MSKSVAGMGDQGSIEESGIGIEDSSKIQDEPLAYVQPSSTNDKALQEQQ